MWLAAMAACMAAAMAQSVNSSHGIGRVDKDHEDSSPYLARTPYTLYWVADPKYKLYGKHDPSVKAESYLAGIHVYDVATGRIIKSSGEGSLSGSMKVPVAGRHRIKVFCTGPINLSFEEDKVALEQASRRGELKEGMTLEAAKASGGASVAKEIKALKEQILARHESRRHVIGEDNLAGIRRDAELAAHLASSVEDFQKRFDVLVLARVQEMKAPADNSRLESPIQKPPTNWNGIGLPPGMKKAVKPAEQPIEIRE